MHARWKWIAALVGWCVLAGCATPRAEEATMIDLDSYRWNNRIALVFGGSGDDADVQQQRTWMDEETGGADERDLVVGYIFEDAPSTFGDQSLTDADAEELRQRFDVAPGTFAFVLIGKDGGVKRRADAPVPTDDLWGQIDSMPMRQREMDRDTH